MVSENFLITVYNHEKNGYKLIGDNINDPINIFACGLFFNSDNLQATIRSMIIYSTTVNILKTCYKEVNLFINMGNCHFIKKKNDNLLGEEQVRIIAKNCNVYEEEVFINNHNIKQFFKRGVMPNCVDTAHYCFDSVHSIYFLSGHDREHVLQKQNYSQKDYHNKLSNNFLSIGNLIGDMDENINYHNIIMSYKDNSSFSMDKRILRLLILKYNYEEDIVFDKSIWNQTCKEYEEIIDFLKLYRQFFKIDFLQYLRRYDNVKQDSLLNNRKYKILKRIDRNLNINNLIVLIRENMEEFCSYIKKNDRMEESDGLSSVAKSKNYKKVDIYKDIKDCLFTEVYFVCDMLGIVG